MIFSYSLTGYFIYLPEEPDRGQVIVVAFTMVFIPLG